MGTPLASSTPSSSTSTNRAKSFAAPGTQTSFQAIFERNCRCATSAGGSFAPPCAHVHHVPPGPSSGSEATRMPGPRRFPNAMPSTWPRFSLSLTSSAIVVASTWLKSLKQWPVFPAPGATSRKSLSPAAHRSLPRTDSQSWLRSLSVSEAARARAFSMRVRAVPGYAASVASAIASPDEANARTGEKFGGCTGAQPLGSGPAPSARKGRGEARPGRGASVTASAAAAVNASARGVQRTGRALEAGAREVAARAVTWTARRGIASARAGRGAEAPGTTSAARDARTNVAHIGE